MTIPIPHSLWTEAEVEIWMRAHPNGTETPRFVTERDGVRYYHLISHPVTPSNTDRDRPTK